MVSLHPSAPCATLARYATYLAAIMGLVLPAGCGSDKPAPPPLAYQGPTLAAADLGLNAPVEAPGTGYKLLTPSGSQGRFPAALAVVRLEQPNPLFVCDDPLFVSERGWEVMTMREQDAAWWTTLMNPVPLMRAIYVLDRKTFVSPDCDLKTVMEATHRLGIDLLLIYGPRAAEENSAAFAGVIVQAETGEYLAYIESQAGIMDFEPPRPDRNKDDQAHQDVNEIAARRFERQVRACVLDLIHHDQPTATTQPSPWRTSTQDQLRLPADSVPVYIVPNHRTGG